MSRAGLEGHTLDRAYRPRGAVIKSTDLNLVVLVSAPTILTWECWQLPDVSFVAHLLLHKMEMVIFVRTKGINRRKMLRTALGTW